LRTFIHFVKLKQNPHGKIIETLPSVSSPENKNTTNTLPNIENKTSNVNLQTNNYAQLEWNTPKQHSAAYLGTNVYNIQQNSIMMWMDYNELFTRKMVIYNL